MLKDNAPKAEGRTAPRARRLRAEMSLPEVLLWRELRSRPNRLKFRRQHASGLYVLDFYCSNARLAVEADSEAHSRGDRPQRDAARDAYFARSGIGTLRIAARDGIGTRGVEYPSTTLRVVPLPGPGRFSVSAPHHIRNTPNWGRSGIGALRQAAKARPSTSRVCAGSMMPSSHSRAVACHGLPCAS